MKSYYMIGTAMYTTILTLHKQGISQRKITRTTNTHRRTVRKIIERYELSKIERKRNILLVNYRRMI
jgi:transcriptional regulator